MLSCVLSVVIYYFSDHFDLVRFIVFTVLKYKKKTITNKRLGLVNEVYFRNNLAFLCYELCLHIVVGVETGYGN